MTIEVKKKHIKEGTRLSCEECPIALALQDAGLSKAWVETDSFCVNGDEFQALPLSAMLFIDKFDNKKKVEPFSFDI